MRYRVTGTFAAYLFGVARNVWREHCRRAVRPGLFPMSLDDGAALEALDAPPDEAAARAELGDDILAALDQLPEEQRMVFVLRQVEGLGLEEIARILNCPVNTVRSRKLLAVKKLRTLLQGSMVI
jgi:RNA polymerase sigma-70 factor (ECF subfamily)